MKPKIYEFPLLFLSLLVIFWGIALVVQNVLVFDGGDGICLSLLASVGIYSVFYYRDLKSVLTKYQNVRR